jgi:hypothetical protein
MLIAPHSPEDVLRGNGPQYHSFTVNSIPSTHSVNFRPICDLCSDASGWKTSTLLLDSIWCDKLSHSWYGLATNVILQSSPKKSWCIQSSKLIAQFFWLYPHAMAVWTCYVIAQTRTAPLSISEQSVLGLMVFWRLKQSSSSYTRQKRKGESWRWQGDERGKMQGIKYALTW